MIDFGRARFENLDEVLKQISDPVQFPDVITKVNLNTSQEYSKRIKVDTMEIRVTPKQAYIERSLHILYNELIGNYDKRGLPHNYDDFGYSELLLSLDYLNHRIKNVLDTKVTQLEFGFNVSTSDNPSQIIKENVLMHQFKEHNVKNNFHGYGYLKRFDSWNYQVKIYDKSLQYDLDYSILRYEIRVQRVPELQKLGVFQLKDLKNKKVLENLFNYLMNRFDDLLIVDSWRYNPLIKGKDKELMNQYTNDQFWNSFHKGNSSLRNQKSKHKNQLNDLLNKHSLLTTKNELRNALIEKYQELMN